MILPILLLIATPDPETAVEAERAFNRAAQTEGQWTAFRKFSTDDAVIFTPQPAKAHEVLPDKEPRVAVQWWPAESYVSCDGSTAVNTGPWVLPKATGYFTTVWVRQADGHFKWVYDGGDALSAPRALPERPKVLHASCNPMPPAILEVTTPGGGAGNGRSPDGTLRWFWRVDADGARHFVANLWDGKQFQPVIDNRIAAPRAQ